MITLNARNEHDRTRFVDDLKESIEEMNLMELVKFGHRQQATGSSISLDQLHSALPVTHPNGTTTPGLIVPANGTMTKSNSFVDLTAQNGNVNNAHCCCQDKGN